MQLTLGDTVTEWVIYALQTFAALPFDLQVVPFSETKEAASERLIVRTEIGEQLLEADQCFMGTLTLTFKTPNRDALAANDVWAKAEAALVAGLQTTGSNTRALELFSRLDLLTENASSQVEISTNFRRYSRVIPLHVKAL